jgi:sugar lactone lactonase YvrE
MDRLARVGDGAPRVSTTVRFGRRPRVAAPTEHELAEGPIWDDRDQRVHWVDIVGGSVHSARLDGEHLVDRKTIEVGGMPGCIVPLDAERAGWLLARDDAIEHLGPDGSLRRLFALGQSGMRFNDGGCDPRGRFFVGTMSRTALKPNGALYRVDLDGRVSAILSDLTIANGIGWSPLGDRMYYVDSATHAIDVFDYDVASGLPANRRRLADVGPPPAGPDGLTVDADGGVWVAVWDGAELRRYDDAGRLTDRIPLPVSRPTSCAFAGPRLDVLVITSAREGLDAGSLAGQPDAGRLFAVRAGHHGTPSFPYRGPLEIEAAEAPR